MPLSACGRCEHTAQLSRLPISEKEDLKTGMQTTSTSTHTPTPSTTMEVCATSGEPIMTGSSSAHFDEPTCFLPNLTGQIPSMPKHVFLNTLPGATVTIASVTSTFAMMSVLLLLLLIFRLLCIISVIFIIFPIPTTITTTSSDTSSPIISSKHTKGFWRLSLTMDAPLFFSS
ncbi:unnamed protein product [Schistocephalus solidus]|uniref:Uncharacterized protein n=1 Tax=Schistocephalus solidus TaxID=70667 RepID=A0A183T4A5_SCHSO|nr:unnamed protein product [Schistocephalus solidus]